MNEIRRFTDHDRAIVEAMGAAVIEDWHRHVALHIVAGDPPVGHLQAVDRGTTPSRRPGCIEMRLVVAPEWRRRGIGSRLYECAVAFAEERRAASIRATYMERSGPGGPDRAAVSRRPGAVRAGAV